MVSRIVTLRPKANKVVQLTKALEEQVLPLLRKQEGFKDDFCLLNSASSKAIVISFWDRKEQADAYARNVYPQILETVKNLIDEAPVVKNYDVLSSTFEKTAVKATV